MQPFSFFLVGYSLCGGEDFGSGSGSKFNCAAPVGSWSDDLGYGPGSGFSFEPVQTSTIYARSIMLRKLSLPRETELAAYKISTSPFASM